MVDMMYRRLERRDALAMGILTLVGVGVPALLSVAAGALGRPSLDDWVYMRGAESLYRDGVVVMPAHTAAAIGQLVLVQPLLWISGGALWAFPVLGLTMTLVAIVATYLLARRFTGIGSALMIVILVEVVPGVARLSASFMTDIPAFALIMLCLLFGTRWLQGEGGRATFLVSLGFGLVAISIREFALAAPVSVLAASWAQGRPDSRRWLSGLSVAFLAGAAGVVAIAVLTPGHAIPAASGVLAPVIFMPAAFVSLVVMLTPMLVLAIGLRLSTLTPAEVLLASGLVLFLFVPPLGDRAGGGGNLWTPVGVLGDGLLFGTRPTVLDASAWALSKHLAALATVLMLTLGLSWGRRRFAPVAMRSSAGAMVMDAARRPDGVLLLFLFAYAVELVLFSQVWLYDRFLYPLIPIAAILLLRRPAHRLFGSRSLAVSHASIAWLGVTAFVVAANAFAYDAARWREGEAAVALGFEAQSIDAGYEWVGYHSSDVAEPYTETYHLSWYDDALLPALPCVVLSSSRVKDHPWDLIMVNPTAYRQYLFFGPEEPLYLYRTDSDGCPPQP